MTALTNERMTPTKEVLHAFRPLAAGAKVYKGAACVALLSGASKGYYAQEPAGLCSVVGLWAQDADNTSGADGDVSADVHFVQMRFLTQFANDGTITAADRESTAYLLDSQTATKTEGTALAGTIFDVTETAVMVEVRMGSSSSTGEELAPHDPAGANLTDANASIAVSAGLWRGLPASTLTTDRTLTLSTTGAIPGMQIQITRLDQTAYKYSVVNGGAGAGTLAVFPGFGKGGATFQFDGTNWALRDCGSLVGAFPALADLSNANWYVDGSNSSGLASDLNTGYDNTHPLLTGRELARRLGEGTLRQFTSVHVMSAEASGDDYALSCSVGVFGIVFYGTKTQVSTTSTFSSVTNAVVPASGSAGGTLPSVTDSTRTNAFWTTYASAQYLVENVTHPAFFQVNTDLGTKNCTTTTPLTDADPKDYMSFGGNDPYLGAAVANVGGDTYKIWQLPGLTFSNYVVKGTGGFNVGIGFKNVWLKDHSASLGGTPYSQVEGGFCTFVHCGIEANLLSHPINAAQLLYGCRVDSAYVILSGFCPVVGGVVQSITAQAGGRISFGGDAIVIGATAVAGGCLNLGACWIGASHAIANSGASIGQITVADDAILTTAARCYGPGTLKGSNGAHLSFTTSASASYRVTGGISLDGGLPAFGRIVAGATSTGPIATTPALIDAATGSSGLGSYGTTANGTRVGLVH